MKQGARRTAKAGLYNLRGELYETIHHQYNINLNEEGKLKAAFVFVGKDGKPIKDMRSAWETACKTAKLDGHIFHDMRRTAVRNMIRAGIPEVVAMRISGHKTRAVFDRYNICSESDLRSAADKVTSLHQEADERLSRVNG